MAEEDLEHFRAGILWAIARLGPLAAAHMPAVRSAVLSALEHPDSQVRGMAVWCLAHTGQAPLLADRPDLLGDEGPVDLFEDGFLVSTRVGRLVGRVPTISPY